MMEKIRRWRRRQALREDRIMKAILDKIERWRLLRALKAHGYSRETALKIVEWYKEGQS